MPLLIPYLSTRVCYCASRAILYSKTPTTGLRLAGKNQRPLSKYTVLCCKFKLFRLTLNIDLNADIYIYFVDLTLTSCLREEYGELIKPVDGM